jgi:hypothetical protein
MTKISVLLMYKRIFSTPKFKTMTWILIGLNVCLDTNVNICSYVHVRLSLCMLFTQLTGMF